MNFFKKALVASAVVATFGANAAVVSSTPLKMSAQGVASSVVASNQNFQFDVVVKKEHPSSSKITITFDSKVDLDALAVAANGKVTTDPATGKGVSNNISFDYGTGSFTFDNVVIDKTTKGAHTLSWTVNLGNPLTANSAFRVEVNGATVDISGASSIAYSSMEADKTAIETGTGIISEEVNQFTFATTSAWNGVIERAAQKTFTKNGDTVVAPALADADTVTFQFTNNEALAAAVTGVTGSLVLVGDFANGQTAAANKIVSAEFANSVAGASTLVTEKTLTTPLTNAEIGAAGAKVTQTITFDGATKVIPATGNVAATLTLTSAAPVGKKFEYTASAGEWVLDATIINVPYFPVGYASTNSSIHFANESSTAADVMVSAIDNNGKKYGPTNLNTHASFATGLKADTVTKLGQAQLMDLLKVATGGIKLSVTFNIDSNVGNVNAYAFSQKKLVKVVKH
jgi:hypothetical protein